MATNINLLASALLAAGMLGNPARAAPVTIPVESSNTAMWTRSDGGLGAAMPAGGPAVWNAQFTASIPAGASNIVFTLNNFLADDKGIFRFNGSLIADAVVTRPNGTAAGLGTFDFGSGAGSQPYNYLGYSPGATFAVPNGTTSVPILIYMNDTGSANPSAPPLGSVAQSTFDISGTITYDDGQIFSNGFETP